MPTLEEMNVRGYTLTENEMKKIARTIGDDYKRALKDIQNQLAELYAKTLRGVKPADYYNTVLTYDRLGKLEKRITESYNFWMRKINTKEAESSRLAITNRYYREQYTLDWFDELANVKLDFALMDPTAVEMSVYGTPEIWKGIAEQEQYRPYLAKHGTLRETLRANRGKDLLRIRQAITQSMITGESYARASKKLQKIMDSSQSQARTIMRTEGNRNLNAGAYAASTYANMNGMENKRYLIATLDDRTREQSIQMDGQVEDENHLFHYPDGSTAHYPGNSGNPAYDINDREATGMKIEGLEPSIRRARDPLTGRTEIIAYKNFKDWAKEKGLKKNRYGTLIPE